MRSKKYTVFGIAALLISACFIQTAQAADAGTIEQLSGDVTITGADKIARKASAKEKIRSGDMITTETKSEVLIKMADDSSVALRPNTKFQFTDFKYEQKSTDSSLVSLLRGTARMISGLIGKTFPSKVKVMTPTATVGIRGTDFEVAVIPEDSSAARAGVYDFVHDGETNIKIASGQALDVKKEQTAFAPDKPKPGEEPLQLLPEPPLFLQQGGGFDGLMQSVITVPINIIQQMPFR